MPIQEKLKSSQMGQTDETLLSTIDDKRNSTITTENLLSKVDNSSSVDRNTEEESEMYEKKSNPGAKLHQLLDANRRTDAVAAG